MFHPQGPTFWELAEQCLSSTERGYDLLASKFDYTPFRTPDFLLDGIAKYLGEPRSIDAALDLCTGTGAAIRIVRPLCRQRVVGIDFSPGMLEIARKHYPDEAGQPPVELILGNVLKMDFREEFDLAVIAGAQGHILPKDEPRYLERIHAALRPGGRFAFVTTALPPWWTPARILSRGFNAAMHVRNLIKRPPFIMFYLTFLLPRAKQLLEAQGFDVTVHDDAFSGRWKAIQVVVATKRSP
jgi:ubiquinone/menaquinone biosynthesis C-methylase UbiE